MKKLSLEPKASLHYCVKSILYQCGYESLPGSTDNPMLIIISQEILKAIRKTFGPITNLPPYIFPKITRITDYELWQCQRVYGDLQAHCKTWNTLQQYMKRERRLWGKPAKVCTTKKEKHLGLQSSWQAGEINDDSGVKGKLLPLEECYQLY